MTKDIPDFEIRFERVCSLENARTLRLAYTITNYGQHPFKYFYACHPLLAATPQTHLLIPKQVTQMFTLGGPDLPTLEPKSVISWPPSAATRFNEPLSGSRGSVMKMYPVDLTRGHAAVTHGDNNEALQIQFDIQTLPHLGILVSQGPSGRDDFQNVLLLSLQPSSGACSDPPQCEEMGMGRTLESGAKLHFWVSLGLIDISSVPRSDNLFWAY